MKQVFFGTAFVSKRLAREWLDVFERLVGQRFAITLVVERGVIRIVKPTRGRSRMTGFAVSFTW